MIGCVLAPLDGSALAERALSHAVALARARDTGLLLPRVLTPTPPRGKPLVLEPLARAEMDSVSDLYARQRGGSKRRNQCYPLRQSSGGDRPSRRLA
jgi:nucleotide-binding universal stress UspA family protein